MLATSRPSPKASPSLPPTSPFPNLPMFQVIIFYQQQIMIFFSSPRVPPFQVIRRSMLERQAPCTTHPWSQGPVPRSSPPLHMSRRSPTPRAMPCQPQWRLQSLQATLGELILEVRWGRDLKAENYLQVLMTYIIQVTKKLTGTKNQHIEVSLYMSYQM